MKKYLSLLLVALSFQLEAKDPQDIVIKSRLDQQTSASFIKRIRTFLINNNVGDPYNQTLISPIVVDLNAVILQLPEDTQSWIKEFQAILNLKVFESAYKLRVEKFAYSIDNFHSELVPTQSGENRVEYVTMNAVKGIRLTSERIAFQVELKRTTSGEPIKFDIELIRPEFIIHPELVMELPMGWHTALMPKGLFLSLHTVDLSKVFAKVIERPELVDLVVKDLKMPQVSIRVGNRELIFDKEKIKKFMVTRKDDLKMAIVDILKTRGDSSLSNIIQDKPLEVFLPRTLSASDAINAVFDIKAMDAANTTRMLELKVDGHFCSSETEIKDNFCRSREIQAKLRREIKVETFDQSMTEIDNMLLEKKANIAVSVSEHYLNQLISAAAEAGMIDLGGDDFKLGPEQAFVLSEEPGHEFNLYLDIIYKLKRSERIMVGRSELHFPVKLGIGLKIVLIDGIPHLQIKVMKIKTDANLLVKGAPQYGLVTNVNQVRFQNKVIQRIQEDIQPFNQKLLLDVDLKEFKDTYLEELTFFSDGKGRGTAILYMNGQKIVR